MGSLPDTGAGTGSSAGSGWSEIRDRILRRDNNCAMWFRRPCFGRHTAHHLWRQGQGGPDDDWNLIRICGVHHLWVHEHPLMAQSMGLLVPTWVGESGCRLSDRLLDGVRNGRPRFAPWLTEDEMIDTIHQDRRWEGALALNGWSPSP